MNLSTLEISKKNPKISLGPVVQKLDSVIHQIVLLPKLAVNM
jgi:hypothetical protein